MLQRLFAQRPARAGGKALYSAAARQARDPAFYLDHGAPDTPEGRFELYSLHVGLILLRLKGQGEAASETGQALFDAFVRGLDDALRELAVGDVVVGKRMKKLGEAIYGRMRSLDQALAPGAEPELLEALVRRTALIDAAPAAVAGLAGYLARAHQALAGQPLSALLEGRVEWPAAAP